LVDGATHGHPKGCFAGAASFHANEFSLPRRSAIPVPWGT
jgi:hypothetical protein